MENEGYVCSEGLSCFSHGRKENGNVSQDSQCWCEDSNEVSPGYSSDAVPPCQDGRWEVHEENKIKLGNKIRIGKTSF
jgi:hypothetical protein